jgi:hypothetical protein
MLLEIIECFVIFNLYFMSLETIERFWIFNLNFMLSHLSGETIARFIYLQHFYIRRWFYIFIYNITEILLKVALNTITLTLNLS